MSADEPPSPPAPIGALLRFGLAEIRARIYRAVADAGFTDVRPTHVTLFRWPGPEGRRPGRIAADAQISKQRVRDLLRDLEGWDYLRLEVDSRDSRARIVRLTARGRRLHRVALGAHAEVEREWAELVGARDYARARATLERVVAPLVQRARERPDAEAAEAGAD